MQCCKNRYPCTGDEIWEKLKQNMEVLQNSLYLPTLLTNLRRKDQIAEGAVSELLGLDKGEAIQKLLDLLKSKDPPGDRSMSDALLETNPDVAERVGLGSLPGNTLWRTREREREREREQILQTIQKATKA